jgi:hypothetical protein
MNKDINELEKENKILKDQICTAEYFLNRSFNNHFFVDNIQYNQNLFCEKEDLSNIARAFILNVRSCVDIGPGIYPQPFISCPLHILVEPWEPYAQILSRTHADKLCFLDNGLNFLRNLFDNSIDTLFLLDIIEHLEKKDGYLLIQESIRVARKQIIIFTPLGFMPQHFTDLEKNGLWGDIKHGETQTHRSGWTPDDFPGALNIIANNYHENGYGAFYSIIDASIGASISTSNETSALKKINFKKDATRILLVSEDVPDSFVFSYADIIIADIKYSDKSWYLESIPLPQLIFPFGITSENSKLSFNELRTKIINFDIFISYLNLNVSVEIFGESALNVFNSYKNIWVKSIPGLEFQYIS